MGLKRTKKASKEKSSSPETKARKRKSRTEVVLSIVAHDNTFEQLVEEWRFGSPTVHQPCWVGRCIHCNAKVFVTTSGTTDATIEHIAPLCDGGDPIDPHNLALACASCNNEKGIRHDKHAGKGGRADEVIRALQEKRASRWREVQL